MVVLLRAMRNASQSGVSVRSVDQMQTGVRGRWSVEMSFGIFTDGNMYDDQDARTKSCCITHVDEAKSASRPEVDAPE